MLKSDIIIITETDMLNMSNIFKRGDRLSVVMSEAAKRARAAYMREWRKRNKEKVKQYDVHRWERIAREKGSPAEK